MTVTLVPLVAAGVSNICSDSLPCSSSLACSDFGLSLASLSVGSVTLLAYSTQGLSCSEALACSSSLPCSGFGVNLVPLVAS
jgi:hypothetical protein